MLTRLAAILFVSAFGLALASKTNAAGAAQPSLHSVEHGRANGVETAGYRRYRDYDDEDEEEDEPYYEAPRRYGPAPLVPPAPVFRRPWPSAAEYGPPVYEWLPPPRPTSCGVFRYWNGERCADARHYPPYIGPRW